MRNRKSDCSIIIVSHQHRQYLSGCLKSLLGDGPGVKFEIIVIDNNSSDGTIDSITPEVLNQITLVRNNRNLGYAKACNQGISLAIAPFILLLNPDVLAKPGTIRTMLRFMKQNPEAACVVPLLRNVDGSTQYSCRRFPGWKETFLKRTPLRWFVDPEKINRYDQRTLNFIKGKMPFRIDWALGGCLMIKKAMLEKIGSFDERFFLYCEDIDWFYRFKRAYLKAYCLPRAIMYHEHLAISDNSFLSGEFFHHAAGILKFMAKHWRDILTLRYPPRGIID